MWREGQEFKEDQYTCANDDDSLITLRMDLLRLVKDAKIDESVAVEEQEDALDKSMLDFKWLLNVTNDDVDCELTLQITEPNLRSKRN